MTDGRFRISPIFSSQTFTPTSVDISDSVTWTIVTSMLADNVIVNVGTKWFKADGNSAGTTWTLTIYGKEVGVGTHAVQYFCYNDAGGDTATSGTLTVTSSNVSYSNIGDKTQELMYTLLKADTTIIPFVRTGVLGDYAFNIFDGEPHLPSSVSSYIIIHTPELSERRLTQGQTPKMSISVTEEIEIRASKESEARELSDAVRNCLFTNQTTTRAYKLKLYSTDRTSLRKTYVGQAGQEKAMFTVSVMANFTYRGV